MNDTKDFPIEQGTENVYSDLGYPDAADMLVKAELAREISQILMDRKLTQQQASNILGMPQPKLSEMLRGKFRGISQAKMIECLNRLGRDVDIVVRKTRRQAAGHTQVVVA